MSAQAEMLEQLLSEVAEMIYFLVTANVEVSAI